jgi:hypothetical protein
MVRRLLVGDRERDSVIVTAMVMDCDHNGDGQQWTAMDSAMTTWRWWKARRLIGRDGRQGMARARCWWTVIATAIDGKGRRDGNLTVMDGAVRWRWMARRQLNSNGQQWTERRQLEIVDGLTAMDGSLTVMDSAARRQWMAQRLLDGNGWRDSSLMAMYGEGQHKHDGAGLRSQYWWMDKDGAMATWRWWAAWR